MCGIAAVITPSGTPPSPTIANDIEESIKALDHRGPDGRGTWLSDDHRVALAHCRLSINDLSPSGQQPLHSDDDAIHAIVNGEIYDFDRLRDECTTQHGYKFLTQSDSELVLALYRIHGAPKMFEHLRGEFAFVLYDNRPGENKVIAARDRFGIKPLYYTPVNGSMLFAAEVKAFLPLGWKASWNLQAVVQGSWMADDSTLFDGVRKVVPGNWMEVTADGKVTQHSYWEGSYGDKTVQETRSVESMVLEVRRKLVDSIRLRLRADVPIGIYLSGGIDSSAIAGIVSHLIGQEDVKIGSQDSSQKRVQCFSIQFPDHVTGYNEADVAERTASWLGVDIHKIDVNEEVLARDFENAVWHCEQPSFDLNFVAKFALSSLPRQHGIKVVLTGEGADEHFAGYPQFTVPFLLAPDTSQPETFLAQNEGARMAWVGALASRAGPMFEALGYKPLMRTPMDTDGFVAARLPSNTLSPSFRHLIQPTALRDSVFAAQSKSTQQKMMQQWHPLHSALYSWTKSAFANWNLTCLGDRTEMAHSIEARPAFLDHPLTEYANGLPPSVKLHYNPPGSEDVRANGIAGNLGQAGGGELVEKWIMREAVQPFVTEEIYKRRKHPFSAPPSWPKDGPLHRMLAKVLQPSAVASVGFLDSQQIQDLLANAFGDKADTGAFRCLVVAAALVSMHVRFGMATAVMANGT